MNTANSIPSRCSTQGESPRVQFTGQTPEFNEIVRTANCPAGHEDFRFSIYFKVTNIPHEFFTQGFFMSVGEVVLQISHSNLVGMATLKISQRCGHQLLQKIQTTQPMLAKLHKNSGTV